jgi:hypothetical protein
MEEIIIIIITIIIISVDKQKKKILLCGLKIPNIYKEAVVKEKGEKLVYEYGRKKFFTYFIIFQIFVFHVFFTSLFHFFIFLFSVFLILFLC